MKSKGNKSDFTEVTEEDIHDTSDLLFGPFSSDTSKDGKYIFVYNRNRLTFIFSKGNKKWVMHPRASMKPNSLALSTIIYYDNFNFMVGEPFECTKDGATLYGEAALRYAAANIDKFWFNGDAVTFLPSEEIEESYPEMEFCLSNRGFRNFN